MRRETDRGMIRAVAVAAVGVVTTIAAVLPAVTFTIQAPSSSAFCGVWQGFGAEWDPWFFSGVNQASGLTQGDWDTIIAPRVQQIGVSMARVWIQLRWCLPVQDSSNDANYTWNTTMMQSLYKYLDFCQANNIHVLLTDWGWAVHPENADGMRLYTSCTDTRYATGMARYIKELVVNRGYTCIKYFDIGNEPDNEIIAWYGMANYQTMYRNIHAAMQTAGVRNLVKLIAPETGGVWDTTRTVIRDLKDILDGYCSHIQFDYPENRASGNYWSYWRTSDMVRGWVQQEGDTQWATKPVFRSEMNMAVCNSTFFHCKMDTYDYAIAIADYCTALLMTRTNAGLAWCMHDIKYFETSGGSLMEYGMWRYKDRGWTVRPWGQSFALLNKFAPRGSIQCPVNINTGTRNVTVPMQDPDDGTNFNLFHCAGLRRPDSGMTVFITNAHSTNTLPVILNFSSATVPARQLLKYQIEPGSYGTSSHTVLLVSTVGVIAPAASVTFTMPANSFVTLVEDMSGTAPAAVRVALAASPNSIPADGIATSTLTATIQDVAGNTVTTATHAVTFSLNPALGAIAGPASVAAVNGVARTWYRTGTSSGIVTVTAAAAGLTSGTANITLTPVQTAVRVALTAFPTALQADGTATSTLTATIQDVAGNTVTTATHAVTFSLNPALGAITGPASVAAVSGVARTWYRAGTSSGTATITASATGLASGTANITLAAVPRATRIFGQATPNILLADGVQTSTIQASLVDAGGSLITSATHTVTFALASGPGAIAGPVSVAAVNGVARTWYRTGMSSGTAIIGVTAPGLSSATVQLTLQPMGTTVYFTLTTQVVPSTWGSVSPSSGTFVQGAVVQLFANPANSSYIFSHWQIGASSSTTSPLVLTMDSDKLVTAYFNEVRINRSPVVSITAPAAGSVLTVNAPVSVSATASDPDGSVTQVQFKANNTPIATVLTQPYQTVWTPASTGTFTLMATAMDDEFAMGDSPAVVVYVVVPSSGGAPDVDVSPGEVAVRGGVDGYIRPDEPGTPAVISFVPTRPGRVTLAVYSLRGALVRTLETEAIPNQVVRLAFDGRGAGGQPLAAGVYILQVSGGGMDARRKVVVLR